MATCCLRCFCFAFLGSAGEMFSTVLSLKYLLVGWFTLLQSIPKTQKSYFKFDSKVNFKFPMREKQHFTSWVHMSAHRSASVSIPRAVPEGCEHLPPVPFPLTPWTIALWFDGMYQTWITSLYFKRREAEPLMLIISHQSPGFLL